MATVRADRRVDWHSNVRLVHGAFFRCGEQKNFAAHGREGARSHGMNMRSDSAGSPNREPQEKKKWVEPVAALLMALATLSTAWCSYQSAAWTRQSNRLMNEFNALERRAGLLSVQGTQQATIHTAMFMEVLAAKQTGNEQLANFYVERFPPDARKAYEAWLAQRPFENPNADPHPFVPKLYEVRGMREAADANAKAASSLQEARNA